MNNSLQQEHKTGVKPKGGGSGRHVFRPSDWTRIPVIACVMLHGPTIEDIYLTPQLYSSCCRL